MALIVDYCLRCGKEMGESRIYCYSCTELMVNEQKASGAPLKEIRFDGERVHVPEESKLPVIPKSLRHCPVCGLLVRRVRNEQFCLNCGWTDSDG